LGAILTEKVGRILKERERKGLDGDNFHESQKKNQTNFISDPANNQKFQNLLDIFSQRSNSRNFELHVI
jgi:hypothetical protein